MNRYASLVVIAGLVAVFPASLSAQPLEKIALSATGYALNGVPKDNGKTTTTKAPIKKAITTADLIEQLVHDEYVEGNLPSDNLPAGASVNFNGNGFEIDKGTNLIVDVSDFLTFMVAGTNDISGAGSFLDANGPGQPPFTQTDIFLATITYDDSALTGKLSFSVTGMATITQAASAPNSKTGKYTATASLNLTGASGEGKSHDLGPFILTGFTLTASGSRTVVP